MTTEIKRRLLLPSAVIRIWWYGSDLAHWLTLTHVYMEIQKRRKIEAAVEVGCKAAYR